MTEITVARSLISHSEVDAFNQCEKKHEYAHIQKLQPKSSSMALNRGTAGHAILEKFFRCLKEGRSYSEALSICIMDNELLQEVPIEAVHEAIPLTRPWLTDVWPNLGWKVIETEREFQVPVTDEIVYPFRVDLIIEHRGVLKIVDHKYTYDAYTDDVVALLPQIPRYIGALRAAGYDIRGGIYNFIRTRKLNNPADRYVQKDVPITPQKVNNCIDELIRSMEIIHSRKANNVPGIRTANKMNCSNCSFANLCARELNGESTTMMREVDFEPNTYGYKEIEQ